MPGAVTGVANHLYGPRTGDLRDYKWTPSPRKSVGVTILMSRKRVQHEKVAIACDDPFLQLEEIEHRTTKVGRPQSNGYIERFHRTLLEERLRIKGRTTWYESVEEMQKDLDGYLETYNTRRPHHGRGMEGTTPYEVFKAGIPNKRRTRKPSARKEVKTAA